MKLWKCIDCNQNWIFFILKKSSFYFMVAVIYLEKKPSFLFKVGENQCQILLLLFLITQPALSHFVAHGILIFN